MNKRDKLCDICCSFASRWNGVKCWGKSIEDDYRKMMKRVAKKKLHIHGDLDGLIDNLGYGNWSRLHENYSEINKDIPTLIYDLLGEVFYCSDRWNWDRFLRTNWIYIRIKTRLMSEEGV